MSSKDSVQRTLTVAAVLCIACSVLVSTAAVSLKSMQDKNAMLDQQKNILLASGLYEEGSSVEEQFKRFEPVLVDLSTGQEVEGDALAYDAKKAAKDPEQSVRIPEKLDLGKIKRREKVAKVYKVKDGNGGWDQLILPVRGKGLWGTMWGYIALAKDLSTVKGFAFYQHKETPGLGAEVDNPKWKAMWIGKEIFGDNGSEIKIHVGKPGQADEEHHVDGLSGATITTRGVQDLLHYWLGSHGFKKYFSQLKGGVTL